MNKEAKTMNVVKVFNSPEELNSSEEYKTLWKGFKMREERDTDTCMFVKGFVTDDGSIYALHKMINEKDDGLMLLNQLHVHSCICNDPFYVGFYSETHHIIKISKENAYDRCMKNRITFAKNHKCIIEMTGMEVIPFVTVL